VTLGMYALFALPLWAALFALYFILRREKGMLEASLIAKCAGSFLAVGSAGFGFASHGINPFTQLIFWFFLLCMIADALLELQFIIGMGVFGLAHICLLVWLFFQASPVWWSLLIWVLLYILVILLFYREMGELGNMLIPFSIYPALLAGVVAVALPLPFTAGTAFWPLTVGAVCFFISDMMVAKSELSRMDQRLQKPIMVLYWGALFLISCVIW
jgi:uncharacterized membrane protein YhhN